MSMNVYPSFMLQLSRILDRVKEEKPKKIVLKPNDVIKISNENPFRHMMMIWNQSFETVTYGTDENDTQITLNGGAVHVYRTHLFTVWLNDVPYTISHADWPWAVYVRNLNGTNVDIVYAEVY